MLLILYYHEVLHRHDNLFTHSLVITINADLSNFIGSLVAIFYFIPV